MIRRWVVHQKLFGNDVINTWHLGQSGADPVGTVGDLADRIRELYEDALAPDLVDDWQLVKITSQDGDQHGTPVLTRWTGSVVGGSALEPAPNQAAVCIVYRATTTRPNKSIKFLGGWRGSMLDANGKVDPAAQLAASNFANDMMVMDQTIPGQPLVIARHYPNSSRVHIANSVETFNISQYPGTQRRRRIGTGS